MTLMAPTVRMSPQSRVGASRVESCLRSQCRAWVRVLLELRARGGLLSCGGRMEKGPWRWPLWAEITLPPPPAWLMPPYLEAKLSEQRVQRGVSQRHGWEEFFNPLASPPLAATGRGVQAVPQPSPQHPTGAPALPLLSRL